MTPSASQVSPMFRHLCAAAYLLVVMAAGVFCYDRSMALFVTAVAAAVIAWLVVESGPAKPAPRLLLNGVLLGAFYYLVREIYTTFLTQSVVIALARFVVVILLCKLFERKRFRDLTQLVGLSLVVAISGAMVAPSGIGFFIVCAAFFVVLAYTAMLMAACRDARSRGGADLLTPLTPASGRRCAADLRRVLKTAFAVMVPVALAAFFLVPRSSTSGFSGAWNGPTQTGFGDGAGPLHDAEDLTPSDEIVMQVTLTRSDGLNIGSEFYQPYFRGRVIEGFPVSQQHSPLPPRGIQEAFTDGVSRIMNHPHLEAGFIREDYTVYEPPQTVLFAAGTPALVKSDQFISVIYNEELGTLQHFGGIRPLRYSVICPARVAPDAFTSDGSRPPATQTTAAAKKSAPPPAPLPPQGINSDVQKLAHQIVPDLPADGALPPERVHEVASAFETYLKTHYRYSLSTRQSPEGKAKNLDPVTDFLLHRQQIGGYCQYFAAGMVVLCRCASIQAREVTGYYGGEFNSVGGYYIVRQKDAHEWVEYYVRGEGWVRSDPTASSDLPSSATTFLSRSLHEISQAVEDFWLSTFVTFDNDSRRRIYGWFSGMVAGILADPARQRVLLDWSPAVLAVMVGPLALLLVRRWRWAGRRNGRSGHRRGSKTAAGSSQGLPAELDFLKKLLDMLGRIAPRPSHQTPREFVAALPLDRAREDAHWLVETAYGILWGGRKVDAALQQQITVAMDRVAVQALGVPAPGPPVLRTEGN